MAEIDPAVRALALQTTPNKHSQKCPVWEHKSAIEHCNCWIVADAKRDVAIVAPLIREQVAQDIETELEALQRHRQQARSEREERAYRTSAHIARGGACVANPHGAGGT